MARPPKLNWENSRDKWKVVYRGKKYRFDGGTGKSDREARKRAEAEWKRLKAEIDHETELTKPHRREYEKVIEEWTSVLTWAMDHDEEATATVARNKLNELQEHLAQRVPPPLMWADRFFAGPAPVDSTDALVEPVPAVTDAVWEGAQQADVAQERVVTGPVPFTHELWRDRLASQERRLQHTEHDDTFAANVERFLEGKRTEVAAGQLSAGRVDWLRTYLDTVMEFAGQSTSVASIDHATLSAFRQHLLERIAAKQISDYYARDVLAAFKLFVRWLANNTDKIEHLPKNIDDQRLSISVGQRRAKTLAREQIQTLVKESKDRTQLYLLLGLNCAMTQQDIADLQQAEVDWSQGLITRKRSKTGDCASVPEVTYRLWSKTFSLLQQERSDDGVRVLLSRDGKPLKTEALDAHGKLQKTDVVRLALRRLSQKTSITFTMKMLKKTAATALRNHRDYQGLESLFLDHAPTTVAHRYYAGVPQELLDEAIEWLGREFGIVGAPKSEKTVGRPRPPAPQQKKTAAS